MTDKENTEQLIKDTELRTDAKRTAYARASITSILAILSIFTFGFAFGGDNHDQITQYDTKTEIKSSPTYNHLSEKDNLSKKNIVQKPSELSNIDLISQVYGNYDNSRSCWVLPSVKEPENHYCMKITQSKNND